MISFSQDKLDKVIEYLNTKYDPEFDFDVEHWENDNLPYNWGV